MSLARAGLARGLSGGIGRLLQRIDEEQRAKAEGQRYNTERSELQTHRTTLEGLEKARNANAVKTAEDAAARANQGTQLDAIKAGMKPVGLGSIIGLEEPTAQLGGREFQMPEPKPGYDPTTDPVVQRTKYMQGAGLQRDPNAPPPVGAEPNWATVVKNDGTVMQVNPKTGVSRGVTDPSGTAPLTKGPSPAGKLAIENNRHAIARIDELIAQIEARPQSVGLRFSGPGALNERMDPEGIDARSTLSNIGSLVLHERSGAAVSPSEMKRLGFIPAQENRADAVVAKLKNMKKFAESETSALEAAHSLTPKAGSTTPPKLPGQDTAKTTTYRRENPYK